MPKIENQPLGKEHILQVPEISWKARNQISKPERIHWESGKRFLSSSWSDGKISGVPYPPHQLLSIMCQWVQEEARWWRAALLSWPELILSALNVFPLLTNVWDPCNADRDKARMILWIYAKTSCFLTLNTETTFSTAIYSDFRVRVREQSNLPCTLD